MVALAQRALTPGTADATATTRQVCAKGYATKRRPTIWQSLKLKGQAMRLYGVPRTPAGWHSVVLDHLIPLEAGGMPLDLANVWPQPRAESKLKDRDENHARRMICSGEWSVAQAQMFFRSVWTA